MQITCIIINIILTSTAFCDTLMAQKVNCLPAVWETWVRFLGWDDPPEEGMATPSIILAWRIPMDKGAWRAMVDGVAKSWTRPRD